ncbi:MAG TPA: PadR family transcriptional regulator [Kofleriaceae bacterium]|nr:PadR family transcriptional regulator [Kofleriaceae bacterium]
MLSFLHEEPMHPYEMQRLLRERHKDELLALKRGSLYHAINRLKDESLIEAIATAREGRRPERTTYRILPEGEEELVRWLRDRISVPRHEPSDFVASISFLVYLAPADAAAQLEARAALLEQEIAGRDAEMKGAAGRVGRINLIESEYLNAVRKAELRWIRGVTGEIRAGRFDWSLKKILEGVRAARRKASARATARKERSP